MAKRHNSPRPDVPADASPVPNQVQSAGRKRNFTTFSTGVLTLGVIAAIAVSWCQPSHFDTKLLWIGPLLAVAFLIAEQLTIDVDVREVGWTISFTEIPLVIGLLVAPFEVVLAAHLVAGLGAQLIRRGGDHVPYNAGVMCLEVAVPFTVAALVEQAAPNGPYWLGAVLGTVTSPMVSVVFALFAVSVLGNEMRLIGAARLGLRTLVVGLLNTSVGLVGYEIARSTPSGWVLISLVALALVLLYRTYSGLLRDQRDLEALSDVSLTVARSGQQTASISAETSDLQQLVARETAGEAGQWQQIVERIREQLNAARVVLQLRSDISTKSQTFTAGTTLPDRAPHFNPVEFRDDPMAQLSGNHVRYLKAAHTAAEVREALDRRDATEALVVPLRGAHQLLGSIEVHDRLSRWRGFSKSDVQLLRTLASHLATALDNRRLLARLRHDAYHDPLTGLLNRTGLREAAAEPLQHYPTSAVIQVDLDVLSQVSDALGHAWGDRMVVAAGRRIREVLGTSVPLARLEGGSFAALLIDCSPERARELAEQLRAKVAEPYPVERLIVEATAAVGYVMTTDETGALTSDVDALLQRADVATRAARTSGDAVRCYQSSMTQKFLRRFQLVTQFRQALDTGQVQVHYQPKLALPSRQVVGAEALVRWDHPEFGRVAPDEFVPAVEATGLVDLLTNFVIEKALIRIRSWLDRGLRLSIAVNLSVRNLENESFPDEVAEALQRYQVPPRLLSFELTESGVMADPERCLPVLRRLHGLGVILAVDDFGTGYSSLAYLRQLPVDEVKIDKSFVLGMGTDLSDLAVVRSIVELGHSLGLIVVAEGVEEDSAREQLVRMGCDIAQGYLISRPLSEDRFESWLQARTISTPGLHDELVLTLMH